MLPALSPVEYVRLFFVNSSEQWRGEQTYVHEYIVHTMIYAGWRDPVDEVENLEWGRR